MLVKDFGKSGSVAGCRSCEEEEEEEGMFSLLLVPRLVGQGSLSLQMLCWCWHLLPAELFGSVPGLLW